jgi:hypothetical protein
MRLSKRLLSTLIIILILLTLLFSYGYVDSRVSYKYEVQTDEYAGLVLNNHQKEIIKDITSSKDETLACIILMIAAIVISINEPTFKGKIIYT